MSVVLDICGVGGLSISWTPSIRHVERKRYLVDQSCPQMA